MFHQPNKSRYVVRALNYNIDYMPDLTKISFTLNVPEKTTKISSVGSGKKVDIKGGSGGAVSFVIDLALFDCVPYCNEALQNINRL